MDTLTALAPKITASICCYCGTGCGVRIHSTGQRVLDVDGDPSHPSSPGKLGSQGLALSQTVRHSASRVLSAQWRYGKEQALSDIALHDALEERTSKRLKSSH